ncbi:hypothetical protein V8E53_003835 [Lactarius tabidus]
MFIIRRDKRAQNNWREAIQYWDRLKDRTARKEWIEPETLLRSSVDVKRNYLGSELTAAQDYGHGRSVLTPAVRVAQGAFSDRTEPAQTPAVHTRSPIFGPFAPHPRGRDAVKVVWQLGFRRGQEGHLRNWRPERARCTRPHPTIPYELRVPSDGVLNLNPSGVRFGLGEIYRVLERSAFAAPIDCATCVGQRLPQDKNERVMLSGHKLDPPFEEAIRAAIKSALSSRHVAAHIFEVQ